MKACRVLLQLWRDRMTTLGIVMVGVVMAIGGLVCFLFALLRWDQYSQYPKFFPLASTAPWKVDVHKSLYETYGDKAVRKYVLITSLVFVILGIWMSVGVLRDDAERKQIYTYPQVWQGDIVPFAGGELTMGEMDISGKFTAIRFNVDENRYEEVEVKTDMPGEALLLLNTTLTNNNDDTLTILLDDIEFFAKPVDEGNNIKGRMAVNGYLNQTGKIELDAGESVPISFWISFSKEERKRDFMLVIQCDGTGCRLMSGR